MNYWLLSLFYFVPFSSVLNIRVFAQMSIKIILFTIDYDMFKVGYKILGK